MVERCVRAHHETYAWENQEGRLLELYDRLLQKGRKRART